MKKIFLIVLGITLSFSGCEKDDICDSNTATTPQLVIDFYSAKDSLVLKPVTDLAVTGEGGNGVLSFSGVSQIKLPLKTTADITKYHFVLNNSDPKLRNEDVIEFDYTRTNQYISRACGFKTLFTLNAKNPFTWSDGTTNDGRWMTTLNLTTYNITDEHAAHLKVYF